MEQSKCGRAVSETCGSDAINIPPPPHTSVYLYNFSILIEEFGTIDLIDEFFLLGRWPFRVLTGEVPYCIFLRSS
jgi:hypothetical protein